MIDELSVFPPEATHALLSTATSRGVRSYRVIATERGQFFAPVLGVPWRYPKYPRGSLCALRREYRRQHEHMTDGTQGGKVYRTTRRQKHFRPRGRTYARLLKISGLWNG